MGSGTILKTDGTYRVKVYEDLDPYDLSYIDTWNEPQEERDRARRETLEAIERFGVWGYVVERLIPACAACGHPERWEPTPYGSCWGIVDDRHGYLEREALAALEAEKT